MGIRRMHLVMVVSVLVLVAGTGLHAQVYYGSLVGTVSDPSSAVLPGATVTITNLSKGTVVKVTTNQEGIYVAAHLTPDAYKLQVEAPGFKRVIREPVLVEFNSTLTVNLTVEVGSVSESVTVSDAPPLIETESGKSTATLEGRMVSRTAITPGARSDIRSWILNLPNSNYGFGGRMLVNGARSNQVRFDTDGVANRQPGGTGVMMQEHSVNLESVGTWKYTLNNAGAESPSPAQITLLTKSGTNEFRGMLYWFTHHSVLDANSHNAPAGSKKPFVRDNNLGFTLSGPVRIPRVYDGKNRTFFMTTYEYWYKPQTNFNFITTPTAAMRNGDFSEYRNAAGALIAIRDPLTDQPFEGNRIPAARLRKGSQDYLNRFWPLPNVPTSVFSRNWYGRDSFLDYKSHRWDARIDHVINAKNNLFFRVNRFWNPDGHMVEFRGTGVNRSLFTIYTYQVTDTHVFTPSLLNEFRFGITGTQNQQSVGAKAGEVITLLDVKGIPSSLYAGEITGVPSISISGISGLSQYSHVPKNYQQIWDLYDNLTFVHGRHTLKFGTAANRNMNGNLTWDKPGTFSFTGQFSRFGLADFLLGIPYNAVRPYPRAALGSTDLSYWGLSFYLQDDFKISRRLTLNAGLRWDTSLPGRESHELFYNVMPATGDLVMVNQSAIDRIVPTFPSRTVQTVKTVTAAQAGYPASLRRTDWNNLAPRLGLAWRPIGEKTVLRAAYGIYYDALSNGTLATSGPWGGTETFVNRMTAGKPQWQWPEAYPAGLPGQAPTSINVRAVDLNIKNPYTQQWNLTAERQLGQMLVRLQYVGTKGTQLYWHRDLNTPVPSTTPFSMSRLPYRQFFELAYRTNGGNSIYNAMNLAVERRWSNGLTFNSYYTWSSLFTDTYEQGEGANLAIGEWYPTFDRAKWRGRETHNPRHRWTSTWYHQLPVGRGKRFGSNWHKALDSVAGGWGWTGILNVESGWWVSPYFTGGNDPASIGWDAGPPDRIADGVRSNRGLQPRDFFLDPQAFVMPPDNVGRFGTSGLNFMQEPSWWNFNLALEKTIPVREQLRLELHAQFQNVFNHGYWWHNSFGGGLDLSNQATFGRMVGGYTGNRTVAFLVRLAW